ncbi:FtsX-like permease family protein [Peptoanaerobacter stomatis]|uniref:FtsX-like permease family protein n=1 Tax=Peptoanaerobacter stomatis TaxID=796937 RepID=UPI003FA0A655
MEFKITKANIKSNFFLYKVYFWATAIILTIFSAFLNFSSDSMILERISESGRVEAMAKAIYFFLLILVVFFLMYFNHFFLKNRSREIGILALLGFSKAELVKILCYESIVILSLSYIFSVVLGAFAYLGIKVALIGILNLGIYPNLYIDSGAVIKLLLIAFVIFMVNMVINLILVMKHSLIEFVNYSKKSERIVKIRPVMSILAFLLIISGYIICLTSYFGIKGIWKIGVTPVFVLVAALIGFGTIILVKFGVPYILNKIKRNVNKLYTPVGNIVYPKVIFRISSKNKLLIVLSLLITMTVTMIGIMTFTLVYPMKAIDRLNPSVIEYNSKNDIFNEDKLSEIAKSNNADVLNTTILRVKTTPSIPITESGNKEIDFFDIVKFSDYKRLMEAQDKENKIEKLEKDGYLLINYYPTEKPLYIKFTLYNDDEINIKKVNTNNIFSFANSVTTLVVDDAYYEKLKTENIGENINITTINGKGLRDSKDFYENFKEIEDIQSSYLKKYTIVRDNSSTFIFISFIAILLVICTASILYFTNLIEIIENKEEYNYLGKIGYSKVEIINIIKKEIGVLYKIPLIIGILNGGFMLFSFRHILIDKLVGSKDLITTTSVTLISFIGIYFLFYQMTKKAAKKMIKI